MQATVETISKLERRLTVSVPMAPIEDEISQRLARMARTVKMAGFRPGKVPLHLVRQNYGTQVRDEVLTGAVERTFGDAVEEHKLRIAGYPSIEQKPASPEKFEFTATFEVFPDVTVGDVSGIVIERPVVAVSDKDVEKTVEVLRKQRVSYTPVKRVAKKGDKMTVMFHAAIEGKEVERTQDPGIELVLGEDGRIPEFDDNLLGLKAGSSKQFDITYPADSASPHLAGKTVTYEVTVQQVGQPVLPEVDAEFARSLGVDDGDVLRLRKEIKESLEQEVAKRVRSQIKEQVFQALMGATTLDLPHALVSVEINRLMQATQANLQQRGLDPEKANLTPGMFEEPAKRNVGLRLILGELVNKNALHASPEQIRAMVDEFSTSFEQPAEVVQWYYADTKRLDEPASLATEENVVAWMLEHAKVTDKKTAFDVVMGNRA